MIIIINLLDRLVLMMYYIDMKNSKQRNCIYEALMSTTSHPTAEELLSLVKPVMPSINLATIYRNLKLLLADGKIIVVTTTVEGKDRFDADTSPHAHFKCIKCSKVSDLMLTEQQLKTLEGISDGVINLSYVGICKNCKNKII